MMLKKTYDKCIEWAGHKFANVILAFIAFLESFIFPIPTDAMLVPMVIAKRNKFLKISFNCNNIFSFRSPCWLFNWLHFF